MRSNVVSGDNYVGNTCVILEDGLRYTLQCGCDNAMV